jgi:hypothetical protein
VAVPLFQGEELDAFLGRRLAELESTIERTSATNFDDAIDLWIQEGRVDALEIERSEIELAEADVQPSVGRVVRGVRATLLVYLRGEVDLVALKPEGQVSRILDGEIAGKEAVRLTLDQVDPDGEAINAWRADKLSLLGEWLGQTNSDIATHNQHVEDFVKTAVANRLKRLAAIEETRRHLG